MPNEFKWEYFIISAVILVLVASGSLDCVGGSESTEYGATYTITTQPAPIIPKTGFGAEGLEYGFSCMRTDDNQFFKRSTQTLFTFESQGYWNQSDMLTYEIYGNQVDELMKLYDFHPGKTLIHQAGYGDYLTISGSHALDSTNWYGGKAEFHATNTKSNVWFDVFILNFTSFSESQVATRILNDTAILDVIYIDSKAVNTTFTITGIPTTYSYSYMTPALADYIDDITSNGTLTITNTSVVQYYIHLDTGLTWTESEDSCPECPDVTLPTKELFAGLVILLAVIGWSKKSWKW